MDAQGDSTPCDDGFCTPLPLSLDSIMTPSPPPAPKRNCHRAMYKAATSSPPATPIELIGILHWLEERCEKYLEESRRWQRSKKALEAQRIRKMQILMSLR